MGITRLCGAHGKGCRLPMRSGGSKQKGSRFERETCEHLSKWLSHGKRDDLFWRSAMSGGRATVKFKMGKKNVTQGGDICAIDPLGDVLTRYCACECKHYRQLNFDTSMLRGYGNLVKVWEEVVRMAKRQRKIPVLIARQNNFPTIMMTNRAGYDFFGLEPILRVRLDHLDGGGKKYVVRFEEMIKKLSPPE